jgi:hypothetical protein
MYKVVDVDESKGGFIAAVLNINKSLTFSFIKNPTYRERFGI